MTTKESSTESKRLELANKIKNGAVPDGYSIPGWSKEYPPFDYQMAGIMWLYLTPKAILADQTGTGKSLQCLGLLRLLNVKGKLDRHNRALIVVPATSVYSSWESDGFKKFNVKLDYAIGRGTPKQREAVYEDPSWEVLLTNYETVRRDIDKLEGLGFKHVILDEADYIKNHNAQVTKAIKRITTIADRVVAVTATPIQNSLLDLHSILEALGLKKVFGSKTAFDRRYHEHAVREIYTRKRKIYKKEVIGYKNTKELKEKLAPYYIRRTYDKLDIEVPEMKSQVKVLDLTPEQKQLYKQVQRGFAKLNKNSPPKEIKAAFLRLRQLCTGTETVGASFDASAKYDWLIENLEKDWSGSKVVVFSTWKSSIKTLEKRFKKAGIGYVTMTSDDNNQKSREVKRQKFWNDDDCQVLIGTTAIEKSLNLQCANIQVNLDMLYNPSRHQQLAGRVQRVGSIHDEAWVFSLVTRDTVEEGVMRLLKSKQAIFDHVFEEDSDIFTSLSPQELYKLIRS